MNNLSLNDGDSICENISYENEENEIKVKASEMNSNSNKPVMKPVKLPLKNPELNFSVRKSNGSSSFSLDKDCLSSLQEKSDFYKDLIKYPSSVLDNNMFLTAIS